MGNGGSQHAPVTGAAAARTNGEDPLLDAARRGDLKAIRAGVEAEGLERAKKHVNSVCDGNKMYATHLAAEGGHAEVLEYLVTVLEADLLARTVRQNTPLHIAARSDKASCCRVLLRAGNDAWAKCRLLWIALRKDRFSNPECALNSLPKDMIRLLTIYIMRDGFEFNKMILARNNEDLIPFEYALKAGARKCVALLVTPATAGQVRGVLGSPLHYAAAKGCPEVCELLLRMRDTRINELNVRGETPLFRACCSYPESAATVALLLQHGADPLIRCHTRRLPVDESDARKYHDSSKLLRDHVAKKPAPTVSRPS